MKRERSKLLQIKQKSKQLVTDSKQMVEDEKTKAKKVVSVEKEKRKVAERG